MSDCPSCQDGSPLLPRRRAPRIDYRPDIDGLRAVAVVAVVAVHVLPAWAPGGFVGVDVFFVISGYLITAITLRRIHQGRFSFADFYARRARRLLPALVAVLLGCWAMGAWLYAPPTQGDLGWSILSAVLFVPNLHDYGAVDYFTAPPETRPLLHLWSLGVEEQFYLLAPLLLVGLAGRRRLLAGVTAGGVLLSLGLSEWVLARDPPAAFYLLPFRAWELGLGMLLALRPVGWSAPRGTGLVGLLLVGVAIGFLDEHTAFPGLAALLPCLGSALVVMAPSSDPANRGLAWGPLPALGRRSYSLYLWHWPVLAFAMFWTMRPPTPLEAVALVLLSLGLTELGYRFVEAPFRKPRGTNGRTLAWAGGAMAAMAVGASSMVGAGRVQATSRTDDRPVLEQLEAPSPDCAAIPHQQTWLRVCGFGATPTQPEVVIWGDSHAAMLADGLAQSADSSGQSGVVVAKNSCAPVLGVERADMPAVHRCGRHNDAVVAWIRRLRPARVVLVARWPVAIEGTRYGDAHLPPPRHVQAGSASREVAVAPALARTVAELVELGSEVVVLGPTPEVRINVDSAVERAARLGRPLPVGPSADELEARTAATRAALQGATRIQGAELVELASLLCDASACAVTEAGVSLYEDDNHLSAAGVDRLRPALERALGPASPAVRAVDPAAGLR